MTSPTQKLYFAGIAGTGMASAAGLCKEAGFEVTGSEGGQIYPPMSDMLTALQIPVKTPYSADNIRGETADLYVIGNALSRGNPEIEAILETGRAYTSFPQLIGDAFLRHQESLVVAGTHGKTTTSSLLAHLLTCLGQQPGFLIGGIPRNFSNSFAVGAGTYFVIEGDEYDTAFFDKGSKFLHYHPTYAILNNIEFDHADIFPSLAAIEKTFAQFLQLVKDPRNIIANVDDPGVCKVLEALGLLDRVTAVSGYGNTPSAAVCVLQVGVEPASKSSELPIWYGEIQTKTWGTIRLRTHMQGERNLANAAQVLACLERMPIAIDLPTILEGMLSFQGIRRRMERLGQYRGAPIYDDFAHHPTAMTQLLQMARIAYPNRRLVAVFEPKNATARRNIFQHAFTESLRLADVALIAPCPLDVRIPEGQRFQAEAVARALPEKGFAFSNFDDLYSWLRSHIQSEDVVLFMSSGSVGGIQHRLCQNQVEPADENR
jgi:UDP-N-acetylmuramate: L-alanyl-gamma-D-glutamyl-meso-diaminopimelate ligase